MSGVLVIGQFQLWYWYSLAKINQQLRFQSLAQNLFCTRQIAWLHF
jgi:hypothetical protein